MLQASQLRTNTFFKYKKKIYKVLKYRHTHLGRGGANIRIKAKNLKNGNIENFNFGSKDKFGDVDLTKKKMQFLYREGQFLYFMDPLTFVQLTIDKDQIGKTCQFLTEGEKIGVLFWQNEPLDVDLPTSVVLKIVECDPGVKGNSATNIFKTAKLVNGLSIRVPLFIKKGDKVKIDTRSGDYIERV